MSDSAPKEAIFSSTVTFEGMGLIEPLLRGVRDAGFELPTEIQARLIPAAFAGKDVIGQAKTGTGKTAAFGLPLLQLCDPNVPMQALVLVPTRELAAQVAAEIDELGRHTRIRSSCIIGGESIRQQVRSVQQGGHILVGTPGRVMDLHQRQQISFDALRFVILDEVDRMLDIGFREDIRRILKMCPPQRQTLLVSATISDEIESLARRHLRPDVEKIVTASGSLTVALVEQHYLTVERWDKRELLLQLLKREKPDTTVVFCRTKATVAKVTKFLNDRGVQARQMHGDMAQSKRSRVMASLRTGDLDVLLASDLAARGLDVDHISHVINYDLPEDPEVYVHRIGRTARAGRTGKAWSFVAPDEGKLLTAIEKLIGVEIKPMQVPDFKPGPLPEDIARERARAQRPAPASPEQALMKRAPAPAAPPENEIPDEELRRMFPDGNIPSGELRKGLGARFKTRRRR